MNTKILEILKAGGAIVLAGMLAYILYKVLTNDLAHIGEYINKNTEVLAEIKSVVQTNTAQSARLETAVNNLSNRVR